MPPNTNHLPSLRFLKKDSAKPIPFLALCELATILPCFTFTSQTPPIFVLVLSVPLDHCVNCPDPPCCPCIVWPECALCILCHSLLHQLKKQEASFWSHYCGGTHRSPGGSDMGLLVCVCLGVSLTVLTYVHRTSLQQVTHTNHQSMSLTALPTHGPGKVGLLASPPRGHSH